MKIFRFLIGFPLCLLMATLFLFPALLFWGLDGMNRIERIFEFWIDFIEG